MVANSDLEGRLGIVGKDIDLPPVRLDPVRDDIEGGAHAELQGLVAGSVLDPVLPRELLRAVAVLLVQADDARRQRDAESRILRVPHLDHDADRKVLADRAEAAAELARIARQHQLLHDRDPVRLEQAELFRLVLVDVGAAVERIEVVFEEGLLGERWGPRGRRSLLDRHLPQDLGHPLHFAGDELEQGRLVGSSRVIVQRDPAGQVGPRCPGVRDGHVIGGP